MTLLNTTEQSNNPKPRMATLQTLEAKMANIEESLSLSMASRRRKGASLGNLSSRSSPKLDTIQNNHSVTSTHSKDHDREFIMQNLRIQLGLDKSSGRSTSASVTGLPMESVAKPSNEHKLSRLKNDVENKKNAIKNLKSALQKLDLGSSVDIDSRIRQAELEYALGREELQLLSIIEEGRAIQVHIEKEKCISNVSSMFSILRNGHQLALHAVQASTGRWNASQKNDLGDGFFVDWVMEGETLQRGDRIIEINGRVLSGRNKDELQKLCANTQRCDIVVIRKKSISMVNINTNQNQQLQQTQADNMRLQHRISYLEEQVKELLQTQKEKSSPAMSSSSQRSGTHITSISISTSPSDEDRPVTYQRGSFVTTIVGGKPQNLPPKVAAVTPSPIQKSLSTTTVNGYHKNVQQEVERNTPSKQVKNLSTSMSKISVSTELHVQRQRREREKRERERYYSNKAAGRNLHQNLTKNTITASMNQIENSYSKRNKHSSSFHGHDERSIKSLDFETDTEHQNGNYDDYSSEPVPTPRLRPTPPKKPLRLSLQRAQSLQAVGGSETHNATTPLIDTANLTAAERKRAIKRIYRGGQANETNSGLSDRHSKSIELSSRYIENGFLKSQYGSKYV